MFSLIDLNDNDASIDPEKDHDSLDHQLRIFEALLLHMRPMIAPSKSTTGRRKQYVMTARPKKVASPGVLGPDAPRMVPSSSIESEVMARGVYRIGD